MEQKNIRTYILYAIGEILLVVIGILIALQVNNWNEGRLNALKTEAYLEEMRENLNYDLANVDSNLVFNEKKLVLIQENIHVLLQNRSDQEIASRLASSLYDLTLFDLFDIKSVAFDNLTSSGNIDLIEDPDLRSSLTDYYQIRETLKTGTQLRLAEVVRGYSDYVTPLILNSETIQVLFDAENNWPEEVSISRDEKAQILSSLYNMKDNTAFQSEYLNQYRDDIIELISMINRNLSK